MKNLVKYGVILGAGYLVYRFVTAAENKQEQKSEACGCGQ
jgi:hypothetical protein